MLGAMGRGRSAELAVVLGLIGHPPALVAATERYLDAAIWGLPAALGFALLRTYFSALSRTGPVMVLLIFCLALDAALTYGLIFGRFGLPALGIAGAGYAGAITQWVMFGGLALYAATQPSLRHPGVLRALLHPDWEGVSSVVRLGLPTAAI